jgi:hypothetical protein
MTDITIFPEWARNWAEKRLYERNVSETDIIHVKDWLNSYSKENPKIKTKIMKLRWEDAILAQQKWHKSLLEKSEKLKKFNGNPNDIEKIMDGYNGNTWNYITSQEGLKFEGEVMGHCVGSYIYHDKNIITLRDKNNIAHVTLEVQNNSIIQIQGKGNNSIHSRYSDDISKLINELNLSLNDINIEDTIIIKNYTKNNYSFSHKDKLLSYIEKNINDDMEFFSEIELSCNKDKISLSIPHNIYYDDYNENDVETIYSTLDNLSDNVIKKIMSMLVENIYIDSNDLFDKIKDVHNIKIKNIHFIQSINEEHVDFLNKITKSMNNIKTNVTNYISDSKYSLPSINNENINLTFQQRTDIDLNKIELYNSTLGCISFKDFNSENISVKIKNSNFDDVNLLKLNKINLALDNVVMNYLRIKSLISFQYKDVFLEHFIYSNQNSNNNYVLFYNNFNGEFKSVSYNDYQNKIGDVRKNKGNLNDLELFPKNSTLLWINNSLKVFKIPDFTNVNFSVDTKNINIIGNNVTFGNELRLNKKVISVGENITAKSFLISDERFLNLNLEGHDLSVTDISKVNIHDNLKFKNIKIVNCDDIYVDNQTCKHFVINYAKNIDMQNSNPEQITIKTKESLQDIAKSFIPPINIKDVSICFKDLINHHYEYDELLSHGLKI